ncbi:OmpA family protein [Runella salmonicolor]|uniref:OmpA family protein n=1 Tax=Runella salmonicolor TaxID=2950278 RepID=A0ABT1FNV6_9BACT|nr:OmpA family protein [Runella salmonicolor]MCP1383411.1 OmpA family protein [Runella salmonicolor]
MKTTTLKFLTLIIGLSTFTFSVTAQNYTRQRDWVVAPLYGIGLVIPSRITLLSGTEAPSNAWVSSYRGELVKSDGTTYTRNYRTSLWGFETYYRWKDRRSENRWSIGLSTAWQRQVFKLNHPFNFEYKGHNLVSTVWNFNYLRTGLMLRRTWMKEWAGTYFQLGGYYSTLFYRNTADGREKMEELTGGYIEGGTGNRTTTYNLQKGVPLIVPEIGMVYGENSGIEFSIAYYHPLQSVIQAETTFYRDNLTVGVSNTNVSQRVLMFNVKLPIAFVSKRKTISRNRTEAIPKPEPEVKREKPKKEPKPKRERKPKKERAPKPEKKVEPEIKPVPKPVPASTPYDAALINKPMVMDNLYFELTKSDLLESSHKELDQVAEWMKANPSVEIRLEGHTDKIGDAEKNLILSRDRVNAVREYLIRKGVSSARIATKGYGDTRLVCKPSPCDKNRRVEMVVTKR